MIIGGTIALSDIERIQIYTKTTRNNKRCLTGILNETGGDFVMNGSIFLRTLKPCCHLKADGVVSCSPEYKAWGINWTKPEDFCVSVIPNDKENWMECVHAIIGGKKIDPMRYGKDMGYKTSRTAIGTKNGRFAYYVTKNKLKPEQLRDILFDSGWDNAIMMDGGGSTCFLDKNGNGLFGDGRFIPMYVVVHLKR